MSYFLGPKAKIVELLTMSSPAISLAFIAYVTFQNTL